PKDLGAALAVVGLRGALASDRDGRIGGVREPQRRGQIDGEPLSFHLRGRRNRRRLDRGRLVRWWAKTRGQDRGKGPFGGGGGGKGAFGGSGGSIRNRRQQRLSARRPHRAENSQQGQ